MFKNFVCNSPPGFLSKFAVLSLLDPKVTCYEAKDQAIHSNLAKLLDQIQYQTGLARSISMKETRIGIKSGQDNSLLNLAVEYPVAIVEQAVDWIICAASLTARPLVLFREDVGDSRPVAPSSVAFGSHNLVAYFVYTIAMQGIQMRLIIQHLARAQPQLLIGIRLGFFAGLGKVFQACRLIVDFRGSNRQCEGNASLVIVRQQLCPAGQHCAGQT